MTVGATPPAELDALIRAGGRVGQIYAGLARIRDRYAALVREKFPRIPRRVSGYNLDELLPENNFHVARALVGSEGTCANIVSATLNLTASPPFRVLTVLGFSDAFLAADAVPLALEHKPIGLEGFDYLLVDFMRRKGLALRDLDRLPDGVGFLLVEMGAWSAGRSARQGRSHRPRLAILALPAGGAHLHAGGSRFRLARARVRPRRHGFCARRARSLRGLGRCRRSARAARQLSARHHQAHGRVRLPQPALRPLRPGLRAHPHQLRFHHSKRNTNIPRVHRSRRRRRDLLRRIALRRARRRPGARGSAAQNVRPRAHRGLPRIQDALGSGQSHESRQAL